MMTHLQNHMFHELIKMVYKRLKMQCCAYVDCFQMNSSKPTKQQFFFWGIERLVKVFSLGESRSEFFWGAHSPSQGATKQIIC